jgi:hypothetical protein
VAGVGSILLVGVFYLGLVPSLSSFAFDYTRNIPLTEAVAGVARVGPRALLSDAYTSHEVQFIPFAAATAVAFVLVRRLSWKLAAAGVAVVGPVLFCRTVVVWVFSPLLFFITVPAALTGHADGETWSEGHVAYGAVGGWEILWLLIAVALFLTRARQKPSDPPGDDREVQRGMNTVAGTGGRRPG